MANDVKKAKFTSTNVRMINWRRTLIQLGLQIMGRIAPRRTREKIIQHFFAPSAYTTTPQEDQALKSGRRFMLRVHDKSIHGWQWGRGPQILFVHGWNSRGIQFLPFFEQVMAAGYAVIVVDGPAHGESMGRTTNYFEYTDVVRSMIAAKSGFDIRGLVAHSLGAAAVINALAHEAVAIDAVLIAPALRLKEILYNTAIRYGVPHWLFSSILRRLEARFGYRLDRDNPVQVAARVRSRLLLIQDRDDAVTSLDDARELAETHSHIALRTTYGLGHLRILGDRAVVEGAVQFLIGDGYQPVAALTSV